MGVFAIDTSINLDDSSINFNPHMDPPRYNPQRTGTNHISISDRRNSLQLHGTDRGYEYPPDYSTLVEELKNRPYVENSEKL